MPHPRRTFLALGLALLVLAASCGDDDEDTVAAGDQTTTTGPDTAVSSPAVTTPGGGGAVTWTRIESRDDLVDPHVAEPDELVVDPDDPSTVLVHFYGGVQECYGANATVAGEDDRTVTIRLEVGGLPEAQGQACIEIAEAQELAVTLDAPVGDRELVAAAS